MKNYQTMTRQELNEALHSAAVCINADRWMGKTILASLASTDPDGALAESRSYSIRIERMRAEQKVIRAELRRRS
jgi:hypothetical protein